MCVSGVTVEYREPGGGVRGAQARLIDFEAPENNDWLAVNQFTVVEDNRERRSDIVLFVNGLPLGVLELKNPADEDATIPSAWRQLQTYKAEVPSLFDFNAILGVSDGVEARLGTLTAGWEWFKPWRTIGGRELAPTTQTALQVAIEGVFEQSRFLALLRDSWSSRTTEAACWSRRWRAITSSTRSRSPSRKRCALPRSSGQVLELR